MFGAFFCDEPVRDWEARSGRTRNGSPRYFRGMLEAGVYLAPSQFEAGFVSTVHGPAEIDATLKAAEVVLSGLA